MFKKMKLAAKIALGFGSLILIALALGSLATWIMLSVKHTATVLSEQNVPEVAVANDVERSSLSTMYAARGYAFTEDKQYLDQANANLADVKKYLQEAKDHAAKYSMAGLKENAEKAEKEALNYEKLLGETVVKTDAMTLNREAMNQAAQAYMKLCSAFLADQTRAMEEEFTKATAAKDAGAAANEEAITADKLKERLQKITLCNDVIDLGNAIRINAWKSMTLRDPKLIQDAQQMFTDVNAKLDELKKITRQEANLKQIEECRAAGKAYSDNMATFLTNWLAREELGKQRGIAADAVLAAAKGTAEMGMEDTAKASGEAAQSLATASTTMIVGLCVAVLVGIVLAIFITRSITGPINRIIAGLTEGSEQVSSAAGQVSAASQSLAEGATEQAAGLEETSSSLEEMASMTKKNAENAAQANNLASEAQMAANSGNEAMGRMGSAIKDIQKSSEETAKIIKVIDEIAFQTNLLALNAAVEAARAGEAGKGFAVVAEEVRNLAMRSAEAAKNTSALIEESVKNAQNGVNISAEVGKALEEIVGSIGKTTDLVAEVAAARQEQSQGIDQVNTAMAQMDKVTQQNAANAEESASASEELSAQAEQMNAVVGDLVALVGGSTGGTNAKATTARSASKKTSLTHADHAFHHIAQGGKTVKSTGAKKAKSAAAVIPLDADKNETNHFEEFNA